VNRRSRHITIRCIAAAAAIAIGLSGCGGDNDEDEDGAEEAAESSETLTTLVPLGDFQFRLSSGATCLRWEFEDGRLNCVERAEQSDFNPSDFDSFDKLADLLEKILEAIQGDRPDEIPGLRRDIDDFMEQRGIVPPTDQPDLTVSPFADRYRPQGVPDADWIAARRASLALRALF
jgi:hypothetical protein